jgi:hypothetical protein
MNHAASASTICRVLKGEADPTWQVTASFLEACEATAEEIALWKARWIRLAELRDPLDLVQEEGDLGTIPISPPTGGYECGACGAWVVNTERHDAWHRMIEMQP